MRTISESEGLNILTVGRNVLLFVCIDDDTIVSGQHRQDAFIGA